MFGRLALRCAYRGSAKPSVAWQSITVFKRGTSSRSHQDETVAIPVGGNGAVNLKISRTTQPTKNNNVLVYLSAGPLLESSSQDLAVTNTTTLRDAFPHTTIVDLQYRISLRDTGVHHGRSKHNNTAPDHRFPTPIHDVFAAWDYITDELELYHHDVIDGKKIYYKPRICLLGSHIGGALALTLALTNPNAISAVAVVDGLVDWTGLDELAGEDGTRESLKEKRKNKTSKKENEREALRRAAHELMRLRGRLFRTHSGYFDAFASPLLFLRAPGRDTPVEPMVDVQGVVMRYGDERKELAIVDTRPEEAFGPYDDDWHSREHEEVHHTDVDGHDGALAETMETPILEGDTTGKLKDVDTDVESGTAATSDTSSLTSTSAETDSTDTSLSSFDPTSSSEPSTPPRRRKVLRRWPPTAQPEDVLLPHINIFTTKSSSEPASQPPSGPFEATSSNLHDTSSIDISPVINLQASEIRDLLRKACFWGRERSFAEERVTLTRLGVSETGTEGGSDAELVQERDREQVFEWLRRRFEERG